MVRKEADLTTIETRCRERRMKPAREGRALWFYLLVIVVILDGLDWEHERSPRVVRVEIALSLTIIAAAIVSEVRRWLRERRKSNEDTTV